MARPERFELPTAWFVARYSIQLSYGRFEYRLYMRSSVPWSGVATFVAAGWRLLPSPVRGPSIAARRGGAGPGQE